MASGIQFRGLTSLMAAYDNNKVIAWSVMYGKLVNAKYIGTNQHEAREALRIFLTQLRQSDTTAVYTLNLYEELPKGAKIKASTEPDLAYNFIITEDEAPRHARYAEIVQTNQDLLNRITALEGKLAIADSDDDDEDDGSIGGIISGMLKDERVKTWLQNKALGLADKLFSTPLPAKVLSMDSQAAKIGAVTADDPILINEEQQAKCNEALEILCRCDPNLGDNLLKIAKIAENDPGKYQMFSKML